MDRLFLSVAIATLLAGFASVVIVEGQASPANQALITGNENTDTTPFVLHLVITKANFSGLSGIVQPMIYIASPDGLQSTANMTLPAHRLIKLIITNYDRDTFRAIGDESVGFSVLSVQGTVGGSMAVLSSTNWNGSSSSTTGPGWKNNVTSLSSISHAFTIRQLGINIPIPPASTVVAYLFLDTEGTYTWMCMCYCGSGPRGWGGSMQTPGWMEGSVTFA